MKEENVKWEVFPYVSEEPSWNVRLCEPDQCISV